MKKTQLLLAFILLAFVANARQAADTIKTGQQLKKFDLLKPTTRQYLRYIVMNGRRTPADIWTRTVTFEPLNGKQHMHIYQTWEGTDTTKNKILDSWFEVGTFRPVTHNRTTGKVLEAYTFNNGSITGTNLPDNTRKDFTITSPTPAFNFETDMEIFQVLPLKAGYVAVLNFYHPGSGKPDWYTFKVDGDETVKLANGKTMDCWILSTDYNNPQAGRTKYWIEKGTQLFIKQETPVRNGFLYKVLFAVPE